jgi:hypothetical protein
MPAEAPRKVVRSYRLVFRRRWRIFRVQNWRIPLPGGLELRALGYWLACLAAIAALGAAPLLGSALGALPPSLRLLVVPVLGAWALSRWEVDGRSPHRALAGLLGYWLRPRALAGLRRCPPAGALLAPPGPLTLAPDLSGPGYPRGRVRGPARLLLRYPVEVSPQQRRRGQGEGPRERLASARLWRLRPVGRSPLHRGHTLDVPAGRSVVFAPGPAEAERR